MEIRSIREAAARFPHLVLLAAVVAVGIRFGSRPPIAILTAVWFAVFAFVYLFARPARR